MADWNVCAGCGEEIPDLLQDADGKWWCYMPCRPGDPDDWPTPPDMLVAEKLEEPDVKVGHAGRLGGASAPGKEC
jgi:hypothetical protein